MQNTEDIPQYLWGRYRERERMRQRLSPEQFQDWLVYFNASISRLREERLIASKIQSAIQMLQSLLTSLTP
jgi:truncated hemoglobin YjbI